ncbi:MAG: molybdenum cofactor guanylyltransferase [Deltaproteobacteria bacterium]|jgi:molybdopterin-guanine dinucleotide biosynthesis protein A|nr:molybdenum cofactor guanylyltransferase [Deltaproteobacteria bacterium]
MKELAGYSAAILCGGQSSRMGSDKAFLTDQKGRLLLASLAERLAEWFEEVRLISDDPQKFSGVKGLDYPVDADKRPLTGPTGAILTALTAKEGRPFFILAGDQPTLDLGIILRLKELLEVNKADVALPRREGRIEPLYAFYGPNCAPVFADSLDQGLRAIRLSFPKLKVSYLDLLAEEIPPGLFQNLNTPKEALAWGFTPKP